METGFLLVQTLMLLAGWMASPPVIHHQVIQIVLTFYRTKFLIIPVCDNYTYLRQSE